MTGITKSDIFLRVEAGSHGAPINSLASTSDGRRMIIQGPGKTVGVWNIKKKQMERSLRWQIGPGRIGEIAGVVLHPNNRLLFIATRNVNQAASEQDVTCTLRIFDLESGDLLRAHANLGGITQMGITLRGRGLLVLDCARSALCLFTVIELLDPDNPSVEAMVRAELTPGSSLLATANWAGAEKVVIAGKGDKGAWLSVFDVSATGLAADRNIVLPNDLNPVAMACSATRIAVAGAAPNQLVLYGPDLAPVGGPISLDEAPDGIAFFSDTRAGRTCERAITDNWLMLGGSDHVARLWFLPDVESNQREMLRPALSLFCGTDGEWVIWSDSCYYNASHDGERYFGFHVNQGEGQEAEYLTADRFERLLNKPGVIREILETGSEVRALSKLGLTPPAIAASLPPVVECHEPAVFRVERNEVDLEISVRPAGNPVKRVWILRNGLPVWEDHAEQTAPRTYTLVLPLVPGENRFKFLATSHTAKSAPLEITVNPADGSGVLRTMAGGAGVATLFETLASVFAQADADISAGPVDVVAAKSIYETAIATDVFANNRERSVEHPALSNLPTDSALTPVKPNLYALVVGVSIIKNPHGKFRNLKYADDDARAVRQALRSQKNGLFQQVKTWELLNSRATLHAIQTSLAELENTVRARDEQKLRDRQYARDVTVIFLAGHGVQTRDDRFFFWNHDMEWDAMDDTGLSFIELGEIVTSFPTELLFLIDACHAEMAGGVALSGIRPDELSRRLVAINEGAQTILSAAGKDELAEETNVYQHGFFTTGVLSVLNTSAQDVSNMGLAEGTMRAVEVLSDRRQIPSMRVVGDLHRWILFRPQAVAPVKPASRKKPAKKRPATRKPTAAQRTRTTSGGKTAARKQNRANAGPKASKPKP